MRRKQELKWVTEGLTKMEPLSLPYRVLVVVLAIVLIAVGAIGIAGHGPTSKKVPSYTYFESAQFEMKDNLKQNYLYNSSYIVNPPVIYTNITSSLNVTEQYIVNSVNLSNRNVYVESTVTLSSTSPSWDKVVYRNFSYHTLSSNGTIEIGVPVNISQNLSLADMIDKQLQTPNSAPDLIYNLTVIPAGISPVHQKMTLVLYPTYYYATYQNSTPLSNTVYRTVTTPGDRVLPVSAYESMAIVALGAALGIYAAVPYISKQTDIIARIKRDHEGEIVIIKKPPDEDAVLLENTEHIFRMAEILELPVFLYEWSRILYIDANGTQYYAELK